MRVTAENLESVAIVRVWFDDGLDRGCSIGGERQGLVDEHIRHCKFRIGTALLCREDSIPGRQSHVQKAR